MTAVISPSTAERILAAAAQVTVESGWSGVTMAAIAGRVGVSRQTVYNEWGSRERVAEAMVLRELAAFLAEVDAGFDAFPDDLESAVTEAVSRVCVLAASNPLLRAIVTATHGAGTELIPLLTTRADVVIATARGRIGDRLTAYVSTSSDTVGVVADVLVRTVLSHVMQPDSTDDLPRAMGWLAGRLLVEDVPA